MRTRRLPRMDGSRSSMGRAPYESFVCVCGESCRMIPHATSGVLAPITDARYPDGNVALVVRPAGLVYWIVPKDQRKAEAEGLRKNHFATCPDRARFGRSERRS